MPAEILVHSTAGRGFWWAPNTVEIRFDGLNVHVHVILGADIHFEACLS